MENFVKLKQFKEVEKFLEKENFFNAEVGKYIKIKRECFDDLVIEKIGEDEYSISLYYRHPSGDSLREPEITFLVKPYKEKRTFIPISYTLDSMGLYHNLNCELSTKDDMPIFVNLGGDLRAIEGVFYNLKLYNNLFKNLDKYDIQIIRGD